MSVAMGKSKNRRENDKRSIPSDQPEAPRVFRSEELFAGHKQLYILHGTETYRLIITRNGKLILQK